MYKFVWESAGILGILPPSLSFHQLVLMRDSCEHERWDRLSYHLALYASMKGAKNVTVKQFHKFYQDNKSDLTSDKLRSMKKHF